MSARIRALHVVFFLFACFLLNGHFVSADNPPQTWNFLTPVALGNCQAYSGPDAQETYTIGVTAGISNAGEPLQVFDVAVGGPASAAGIQKGDALWGERFEG